MEQASRFRRIVWAYYKKHGRHTLPWRNLPAGRQGRNNAYKILVSEIMLQQTQVERVIPFYTKFIKKFPTARALARAPLSEVLKSWQGLGYNRRAKQLRAAAQALTREHHGRLPRSVEELEKLPGIGPYTARAVAAFAFNQDVILIETNIRTAVSHHFFAHKKKVSDKDIEKILARALPRGKSREWYNALMDYGAHLKRSGITLNARNTHYTKQTKFAGYLREARGAIVRALTDGAASRAKLMNLLGASRRAQVLSALSSLRAEGLIRVENDRYMLAD